MLKPLNIKLQRDQLGCGLVYAIYFSKKLFLNESRNYVWTLKVYNLFRYVSKKVQAYLGDRAGDRRPASSPPC